MSTALLHCCQLVQFALMIACERSIKIAKQNPLQSYNAQRSKILAGELLDRAYTPTEKIATPVIAGSAKYGATSNGWKRERG